MCVLWISLKTPELLDSQDLYIQPSVLGAISSHQTYMKIEAVPLVAKVAV